VRITGTLAVTNIGTIALDRTSDDPLTTPYRRTVMTYGALSASDAATLAQLARDRRRRCRKRSAQSGRERGGEKR
jgi:hypothetical protein